ncbi:MAG: pyridoxamine 5'-phosphate oxidase family protein [Thermoleophilaceae bacterium]
MRALWYLWEGRAFWWLTGGWSRLGQLLERDPRVALVVDTCDLDRGEVLQVTARGSAELHPFEADRARCWGRRYLGPDERHWRRFQGDVFTIPRRASSPLSRRSSGPATCPTDCGASQREPLASVLAGSWPLPLAADCEVSRKPRPLKCLARGASNAHPVAPAFERERARRRSSPPRPPWPSRECSARSLGDSHNRGQSSV